MTYRRPTGTKSFAPKTRTETSPRPKVKPWKSEAYLGYIRSLSCAVCNSRPVQPHHLKTRGSGGGDETCVPLCAVHHSEWHTIGGAAFDKKYSVNLWECAKGLRKTWRQ